MEFYDEIAHGEYSYPVEVIAEWKESDCSLYPGYWDIRCEHRITGEDLTRYLSREDTRRLERRARLIAEDSWNDAYEPAS